MNNKGTLYGVSVGVGDPEHLTLKGQRILQQSPLIACPQTTEGKTLALDIIRPVVDLEGKEIIPLVFLMTRDKEKREECHRTLVHTLVQRLQEGEDVAVVNLGDISLYSTFSYLAQGVQDLGYEVEIIPGVTSFSAVASRLQISLTSMDEPVTILPSHRWDDMLHLSGTKILMKTGKSMPHLLDKLKQHPHPLKVMGVECCGLPNETIFHNLEEIPSDPSYFTTIIVQEERE